MRPLRALLRGLIFLALVNMTPGILVSGDAADQRERPNVLMIIIDDHSPRLHSVFNSGPVETPSMQRLADRGTWFTRGYVDSPGCCPSRTAMLTGVHATRSGVYYNAQAYRRAGTWISEVQNLPQHFLEHGYLVAGYGKIAHNSYLEDEIDAYTPGYYKMFNHEGHVTHTESDLIKQIIPGTRTEIPDGFKNYTWGVLPDDWDRDDPSKLQQDTEQVNRTIALLEAEQDRPFFVACGIWRPHVSWTVPKRYFDMFPLESIEIPEGFKGDDLDDLPKPARWIATHRNEHDAIVRAGLWKKCLQAFYASVAYADEQVGRLIDALESGPNADNTIVVFFSDNGWHTGEKNHWSKFVLWELANKVVFSVSIPGGPVQISNTPVSLLDLYPTLISLCGLPRPTTHELDGIDIGPILRGESTVRGAPVLNTYGRGNHAIVDERFRYIRYRDGGEELYDHLDDPHEWNNLASDSAYGAVKERLSVWLPEIEAPSVRWGRDSDINVWEAEAFEPEK